MTYYIKLCFPRATEAMAKGSTSKRILLGLFLIGAHLLALSAALWSL